MTHKTQVIQAAAIRDLFPDFPEDLGSYVGASNPIYVGRYHDEPVCIVGLIPQRESGVIGIWSWNTPQVFQHPIIYAREVRCLIHRIQQLYPIIIGGCFPYNRRWLSSLGATFNHDSTLFRIEAPQ
jgi:hypothetical protein